MSASAANDAPPTAPRPTLPERAPTRASRRPATSRPTRIVTVRGDDARGPRRPRRRRGAARDPRRRSRPGPGRGRRHDADARATRRELAVGFLRTEGLIDGPEVVSATETAIRRRSTSRTTRSSSASRARSTHRASPSAISSRPRRAGSAARPRSTRSPSAASPIPPGPVVPAFGRSSRCRTCCARPSAPSTQTGGLHAAALFTPARRARRPPRGRRAAQRARQGHRRRRCSPARCRSDDRIAHGLAAGSASRSSRRPRSPASRSCAAVSAPSDLADRDRGAARRHRSSASCAATASTSTATTTDRPATT